ncbi:MAG TPA: YbaK/EbsC family protein [Bacteroidales bacterium]|nr:YbaK/EbsC family protein [Bacteroidales bacterium]
MINTKELAELLTNKGISYTEFPVDYPSFPPPVSFWEENKLQRCKNIFFRDNHGKNHFFVVLDFDSELNINLLKEITGQNTLSFASPKRLKKYLGQEPGAVSVLGLVNDRDHEIRVFIDQNLDNDKLLSFLPGDKNSFFALTMAELKKFLNATNHEFRVAKLY